MSHSCARCGVDVVVGDGWQDETRFACEPCLDAAYDSAGVDGIRIMPERGRGVGIRPGDTLYGYLKRILAPF